MKTEKELVKAYIPFKLKIKRIFVLSEFRISKNQTNMGKLLEKIVKNKVSIGAGALGAGIFATGIILNEADVAFFGYLTFCSVAAVKIIRHYQENPYGIRAYEGNENKNEYGGQND